MIPGGYHVEMTIFWEYGEPLAFRDHMRCGIESSAVHSQPQNLHR